MKNIYFMKGTPLSGKSTYVENVLKPKHGDLVSISFDDHLEMFVKRVYDDNSLTYNECYNVYTKFTADEKTILFKELDDKFKLAMKNNNNIVIDQTNITTVAVARYMQHIDRTKYKLHLIDFRLQLETLLKRNLIREKTDNKHIPVEVIVSMWENNDDSVKHAFKWDSVETLD